MTVSVVRSDQIVHRSEIHENKSDVLDLIVGVIHIATDSSGEDGNSTCSNSESAKGENVTSFIHGGTASFCEQQSSPGNVAVRKLFFKWAFKHGTSLERLSIMEYSCDEIDRLSKKKELTCEDAGKASVYADAIIDAINQEKLTDQKSYIELRQSLTDYMIDDNTVPNLRDWMSQRADSCKESVHKTIFNAGLNVVKNLKMNDIDEINFAMRLLRTCPSLSDVKQHTYRELAVAYLIAGCLDVENSVTNIHLDKHIKKELQQVIQVASKQRILDNFKTLKQKLNKDLNKKKLLTVSLLDDAHDLIKQYCIENQPYCSNWSEFTQFLLG